MSFRFNLRVLFGVTGAVAFLCAFSRICVMSQWSLMASILGYFLLVTSTLRAIRSNETFRAISLNFAFVAIAIFLSFIVGLLFPPNFEARHTNDFPEELFPQLRFLVDAFHFFFYHVLAVCVLSLMSFATWLLSKRVAEKEVHGDTH